MRTQITALVAMSLLSFSACEKNDVQDTDHMLSGSWINPQANDVFISFERSDGLKDNDYGFSIHHGGKFVERKNSGWCGTPPVSYADFEGNWIRNDSVLNIKVGYWGGRADYKWKILELDNARLTVEVISQEYTSSEK